MLTLNYLKDGDQYRVWPPEWHGDNFVMISKSDFAKLSSMSNLFVLVDYEFQFMNHGE